jgi:hypothetical protein
MMNNCCYDNDHDATISVFCWINTSLYKHVDMIIEFENSLEGKRGLSLGSSYVHFASCFPTVIYNVLD